MLQPQAKSLHSDLNRKRMYIVTMISKAEKIPKILKGIVAFFITLFEFSFSVAQVKLTCSIDARYVYERVKSKKKILI